MGQLFSLFVRDIPLFEVDLVGEEGNDHSVPSLILHIVNPLLDAVEGVPVRHVVYDNCH
jgi:hypothetical protein